MKPAKIPGLLSLQLAIYNALTSAGLTVYDAVPENAAAPYVTIGESTSTDDGSKNCNGDEITETVHVWSEAKGFRECKQIIQTIIAALSATPLSDGDYQIALIDSEISQLLHDPDGMTRHGVIRLTFKVYQEA